MMIFLTRPKYYIPVKGEYRMLCANAMIAEEMGIPPEHILLLDNGQVAQFEDGELVSTKMELQLHDTMIDGKENWDMAGVVLKDREILSTDGVMILAIGVDAKTKKIVNGPDIQSRGLIYLKDSEYITSDVAKIMGGNDRGKRQKQDVRQPRNKTGHPRQGGEILVQTNRQTADGSAGDPGDQPITRRKRG